jgi:AAA domain
MMTIHFSAIDFYVGVEDRCLLAPAALAKVLLLFKWVSWAVGRECFGIVPRQALKILYIQAENDEGDLCEMRDGVLEKLQLTKNELDILDRNFICAFESSRTREGFVAETLEPLLEEHKADLVILDPALSYIGGDANQQEIVGGFVRNLLTPVLQKHRCAAFIIHHTAKPITRDNVGKLATDFAYFGAGSAEWANWARAVLVLSAKDDNGLRELRIGKRFRLGWRDAEGNPCTNRLLRQNSEGGALYYTEVSADQTMVLNGKLSPFEKVLRSHILPLPGEEIAKDVLIAQIAERKICGLGKARKQVLELLISEKYVEEIEKPRSGARAEKWLRRTQKEVGKISFASRVLATELDTDGLQTAPVAVCN